MTNKEIHDRISELRRSFDTEFFTYSEQNQNIRKEIQELQALCPHREGLTDFSLQHSCPICYKLFSTGK